MLTIDFKQLQIAENNVLLDIGCGEGRHAIHAAIDHNVLAVGIDLQFSDLLVARDRFSPYANYNLNSSFNLLQATAYVLPFADNSVDKIICSEVLEHVENYERVLTEIYRVLKPSGILAVSVPRTWPEKICWALSREYHEVEGGHIRIFNALALQKKIQSIGFTFFHKHWAHALHSPFWWMKCLWWKKQHDSKIIALYHRLLVWDLLKKPWVTQSLEKLLNPLMGKSVVLYFTKAELNA
jgi:SAM-dependent methyltransferase